MNRSVIKTLTRIVSAIFCLVFATIAFAQFNDWKGQKLQASLKRKRPPEYFIIGKLVKLQVVSQNQGYRDLLRARLESGLFAQDSDLKSEEARPETIITCEITRLDADDNKWETRTTTERQKTGERQKWNAKKQKNETEDIYTDVQVTKRYKIVKGGINISYQTKEVKTKATLDAQNIQDTFSNQYLEGSGSPSDHEVREMLINLAVEKLVKRLTPTIEVITVNLPRNKVENFSKFGQAGLWEKMREGVDKMGTLVKSKDEAYRQFGLGISNEALGYQSEKLDDSIKLLEEAIVYYNKALELHPEEKYFLDPMKRIEDALAQYKKLAAQQASYARAKSLQSQPTTTSDVDSKNFRVTVPNMPGKLPLSPDPKKTSPAMNNLKVVEMVKAGVDEAHIISAINSALAVQFDLGVDGLIDLGVNKVSKKVIDTMIARQNKRRIVPPRKATPARKKN